MKDTKINTESFWENGYLVIKNVFDREEIEEIRKCTLESASHKGDLLSNPLLRNVILDDRVLRIAREILGGKPVYFGDSTFDLNSQLRGYHKDNADRCDINAPDWQSKYTLIRFGLYLQDHSTHSGGLNLRVKSHNTASVDEGKTIYLATEPGDLAVWSLRTTHSGNGYLLKFLRGLHLEPRILRYIAFFLPFLLVKPERERLALFFTLGLDDHHLERLIQQLKTRKYMVSIWEDSKYDDDVWDAVKGKNLIVKNVWEEIKGEEGLGQYEFYTPIPY